MSNYKIPFHNGQMLHCYSKRWSTRPDLVDNYEFEETLYFKGSHDWAVFSDDSGHEYYMGNTEFNRIVPLMIRGSLKGKFTFVKRGNYFGIVLVEEIL